MSVSDRRVVSSVVHKGHGVHDGGGKLIPIGGGTIANDKVTLDKCSNDMRPKGPRYETRTARYKSRKCNKGYGYKRVRDSIMVTRKDKT